jgi:hypothetical protein
MTADQDSAIGTYVLPWGAEVHITAPMGQRAPELHLTLPGQQPVRLGNTGRQRPGLLAEGPGHPGPFIGPVP